ncbi:helix-turn-helix transcriptional regulator [Mesorhizobium sp. AaZ16]|uniref:helix-turn-helix transcriptional regulator n=1 Tax=Mesorhizobium sp. AaZ16 TaxID=3402289 RepID=UPI00374EC83B
MIAANDNVRHYPPEWCSAETMAYLLDVGVSTFRAYTAGGLLPPGVRRGGSVRWRRQATLDAWDGTTSKPVSRAVNDNSEDNVQQQIVASIKRHGATKKARG